MNFLTVTEAAERLEVKRQMVHYYIRTKQLRAIWMLNRWAIPTEEVTKLKRQRNGRAKTAAVAV